MYFLLVVQGENNKEKCPVALVELFAPEFFSLHGSLILFQSFYYIVLVDFICFKKLIHRTDFVAKEVYIL